MLVYPNRMRKILLFSGTPASGKTSLLLHLVPLLQEHGRRAVVAKMDCLEGTDGDRLRRLGIATISGISGDICPDHFLVSNLPELWKWAEGREADYLCIESAGLCHRCSPATRRMLAITVVDATAGMLDVRRMGPMVWQADHLVLTKCDLVSQAEREILRHRLREANPRAKLFACDGREGYGTEAVAASIRLEPDEADYEEDELRHPMPSGVCSYCVGETRVGSEYQAGIVGKIDFGEEG